MNRKPFSSVVLPFLLRCARWRPQQSAILADPTDAVQSTSAPEPRVGTRSTTGKGRWEARGSEEGAGGN